MPNRKAATDEIVKWLDAMVPNSNVGSDQRALLEALSDEAFESYMDKLESGEETVSLVLPNLSNYKLDMNTLINVGEQLGYEFYQRLWLTDPKTGVCYLTPERYLILMLPLRRQQQMLTKKISIPENNRHVDELTGQPTGDSQGASLSFPEVQILRSQELDSVILEMMKVRGGDDKAFRFSTRQIIETGDASLDTIMAAGTRVRSTVNLGILLKGMHLDNNV